MRRQPLGEKVVRIVDGGWLSPAAALGPEPASPREGVVHETPALLPIAVQPRVEQAAVDDNARPLRSRDGLLPVVIAQRVVRLLQRREPIPGGR